MDDREIKVCAEALISARLARTLIEGLPISPASVAEAHAIQDVQTELLGEPVGGFKVNVNTERGTTRG